MPFFLLFIYLLIIITTYTNTSARSKSLAADSVIDLPHLYLSLYPIDPKPRSADVVSMDRKMRQQLDWKKQILYGLLKNSFPDIIK